MRPAINVGISVSRVGGNAQITPMRKVAGRLKLELSQYRELEAFSQFGSELDPETQRTLARGERLVKTLNQPERHPMPVEDQVVQVYAATNGYLDRIVVDKVERFLAELTESMRGQRARAAEEDRRRRLERRDAGEVESAVSRFAEDFGFDLDEEGHPLEDGEPEASGNGARRQREEQAPAGVSRGLTWTSWHRSATFATASARSRTSRRSPARWSWSLPPVCAAPSSGSRRCAPTRTRSGG